MWGSCCQWLCLDSADNQASAAEPHSRSYTNSAFSGRPTPPPERPQQACKACGHRLDAPSVTKHVCADCKENYCGRCSAQSEPRPRLCHTCCRFHGHLLQRAELMKLKVKELRDYLHLHHVATHLCREKEELVELILSQQPSPSESPERLPASDVDVELPDRTPGARTPESAPADTDASYRHLEGRLHQDRDRPPDQNLDREGDTEETDVETVPETEEARDAEEAARDAEEEARDAEEARDPAGRRASLSDLSGEDDVEALSVRQLKEILARNFVNFKGCCEKWELMERVARLYRDRSSANREDSSAPAGSDHNLCRICMDAAIDCVLLECGHMITCTKCGKRMNECPICRQFVIRAVHVFRS